MGKSAGKKNGNGWKTIAITVGVLAATNLVLRTWRRFPVRGKVTLISGSSRGLGLALAEQFGRAGARIVLTARDAAELGRARALLLERGAVRDENLLVIPCDVRENEQVVALVREVARQWGEIQVLVNNAGVISVGAAEDQPLSVFEDAIRSNYMSMVHTTLAVLPLMLARRDGAIVNIASIGGKVAIPHLLPYSGSKFAAVGFSQGLHAELRSKGIRVTTVTPGLLRTGSPRHAFVVGDREEEFRWFNLGGSIPGIARGAYEAAGRILRATETGEVEFSITPQAAVMARLAQLSPGLTASILGLVNRVLPAAPPGHDEPKLGGEADSKDFAALTGMGREAEREWNE